MTQQQGTVWDGVLAALVLFAIVAFAFLVLMHWAWKRDQRVDENEEAEAHKRLLRKTKE